MPVRQFLTALVPVVSREPGIFFAAVDAVCALEESPFPGGRQLIVLKKPKVLGMPVRIRCALLLALALVLICTSLAATFRRLRAEPPGHYNGPHGKVHYTM